ncbi:MAG: glutathione-disulfide reductase [Hyphomicrobium sp.]|uniref:glutathione-disulfide reductase n=1 Tax=Hyphomicrobium sp. TaxID=82 RepID=UPI001326AA4C|nr:glutathione-disulfide reductase [Hyphomicrobium sp.]KAB2940815.1 MAG: glutathione-disulfide reductase [Hyphomicrobium sp.]MBZ0209840.1 glutathione-disulfide reductase [Hyphomicrobium sp.]
MAKYDYDLFVIGAGSGGVRAGRIAAGYGARVAIAEEYRVGGTCVIRGCVPKKLLVYASRFADDFEDARGFGWTVGETRFDWGTLIAAKDKELSRLEAAYRTTLGKAGVELLEERAIVVGPNAVQLTRSGRTLTADKILIATGGSPSLGPEIPGREHLITSNEAFELKRLPKSIIVAGGGYIAMEFAGIFSHLGVETTIVYRGDKVLRGFDEDLRNRITAAYAKQGIRFVLGHVFTRIEKASAGLVGHLSNGTTLQADAIMFAIGRTPNTAGLGLDKVGVELGWNGHVVVNAYSKSSVDSIFAVGDVTDRAALTPVAIREAHAFADTEFGGKPRMIEHTLIPTAVFATPEIASIGLPEHLARERCTKLDVYKADFRPMKATLSGRDERMFMKLLVDGESGKVVGCHVLGEDAAEIIQMAAVALRLGATKADFDATMALHPTAAEEFVTMREKWIMPTEAAG